MEYTWEEINKLIHDGYSFKEIRRELKIGRRELTNIIRENTGKTFMEYKIQVRKENPKEMPKLFIDWDYVTHRLEARASAETIARELGITRQTLYSRSELDLGVKFSDFRTDCRASGLQNVENVLYEKALDGDVKSIIWITKNWGDYADRKEIIEQDKEITVNFNEVK